MADLQNASGDECDDQRSNQGDRLGNARDSDRRPSHRNRRITPISSCQARCTKRMKESSRRSKAESSRSTRRSIRRATRNRIGASFRISPARWTASAASLSTSRVKSSMSSAWRRKATSPITPASPTKRSNARAESSGPVRTKPTRYPTVVRERLVEPDRERRRAVLLP